MKTEAIGYNYKTETTKRQKNKTKTKAWEGRKMNKKINLINYNTYINMHGQEENGSN